MHAALAGALLGVALSGGGGSASKGMMLAALSPAPRTVQLETRSFGTVELDHAAHLARRTACRACHGPGPVTKIGRFEPKVAHERCVGCHKQEAKGPTACRDCHAVAAPSTAVVASDSTRAAAAGASPTTWAEPGLAAPLAASGAIPSEVGALRPAPLEADGPRRPARFLRVLGVGYAVLGGSGQDLSTGPALSFSMREGDVLLLYALERGSARSGSGGRTLGLVGAGLSHPIGNGWSAFAAALGGFDAGESPVSVVPTLGLRAGLEWLGRRITFSLGATATADLARQSTSAGGEAGGPTFSLGATVGYVLTRD
jgi:hypothetical protein